MGNFLCSHKARQEKFIEKFKNWLGIMMLNLNLRKDIDNSDSKT